MVETTAAYPVSLAIDYPDRNLNRLTTFFRIFTAIPIFIILFLLPGNQSVGDDQSWKWGSAVIVFLPLVLMILFRQKYPKWWFDWNLALVRFGARITAYIDLLTDEYPSTDEEQVVHIDILYPDAKTELNRWLPLVKWFLAIPHYFVLCFLFIAATVCVIFAWFAILFTGRYPRGLFEFVVDFYRWYLRVLAYAFLLTTDRYPPFQLSA
ncbi:DUF4389 domain-containing protein [Chloroflexota bacterium]